jgi:hypothetical protein
VAASARPPEARLGPSTSTLVPVARHEVAVRTTIAFHTRKPPFDVFQIEPEQVTISFEGRDFVWHPNLEPSRDGEDGGRE